MRLHGRGITRSWMLVVAAVLLLAVHGFIYRALANMTLPAVVVSGAIILIAIKLLAMAGLLFRRTRRRSRS